MIRTSTLSLAGALAFGLALFVFANDASAQCCGNYGYSNHGYSSCNTGCQTYRPVVVRRHWGHNNCCQQNHYGYNQCGTSCGYGHQGHYGNSYVSTGYNSCNSCGNYSSGNYCNTGYNSGCNSCGNYAYTSAPVRFGYNRSCNTCGNYGCNTCGGGNYGGMVYGQSGCNNCAGQVMQGSIQPNYQMNNVVPMDNMVPMNNNVVPGGNDAATPPNPDDT